MEILPVQSRERERERQEISHARIGAFYITTASSACECVKCECAHSIELHFREYPDDEVQTHLEPYRSGNDAEHDTRHEGVGYEEVS